MIGVFEMHDMEPGPLVFIRSNDLVWVVFAAMFFANIAILLFGFIETKTVVHLLRIPFHFLSPGILLLATVGAYAVRNLVIDVVVMFVAGIAAYFLRRSGYSVAGIILGLILGRIGEVKFAQAMQIMHYDLFGFLDHPIAAVLLAAGAITMVLNMYRSFTGKHRAVET